MELMMDPSILAVLGEPSAAKGGVLLVGLGVLMLASLLRDKARAGLLRCPSCRGSGKYRSTWRAGAFGRCPSCDGTGSRRRIL
jgi:hypothetical protein